MSEPDPVKHLNELKHELDHMDAFLRAHARIGIILGLLILAMVISAGCGLWDAVYTLACSLAMVTLAWDFSSRPIDPFRKQ
jgi:hypothetical protein